jgi:PIN domain nuclease of toxin-antitoxin system
VRLLVDSHVALWWVGGDSALGPVCARELDAADEVFFSVVTPWELGIKRALGKLEFPRGLATELMASGLQALPISVAHAELAPDLPAHHRDPFDRMLVAQATLESLVLVTADRTLEPYDITILDARR